MVTFIQIRRIFLHKFHQIQQNMKEMGTLYEGKIFIGKAVEIDH